MTKVSKTLGSHIPHQKFLFFQGAYLFKENNIYLRPGGLEMCVRIKW